MKMTNKMIIAMCSLFLVATACSSKGVQSQSAMQKESQEASKLISDATSVVQTMDADPNMQPLIQNARGIFVIPHFTQAALGVGGKGGEGILMTKRGDTWSDPAFYDVGGLSLGLQAGAERGALVFILNNERAVQKFMNQNNFQVSANAGLTIANYSREALADLSRADLVAWSDSKGLFGGASIGIQNVRFDKNETSGFFGKQDVNVADIMNGNIKAPEGKVSALKEALLSSAAMTGGSTPASDTNY
ncbi:MAG: lipid-binding SYLF domain-containing protein [Pseudobdellovibrionaceae bacterium]